MKVLQAPSENFIKRARGQIATDVASGSSVVIPVINSEGFAVNEYVVVGIEGSEGAELCQVTAVDNTDITVATLKLAHKKDEPVTQYRYNKRKFYGATSATGVFFELTSSGSPVDIKVTDPQGTYLEYTGNEGYTYFKATYYNSQSLEETSILDSTAVAGDESIRYCSIFSIRQQAGMVDNPFITDGTIEDYRKRAENEIKSYIMFRYNLPLAEVPAMLENITKLLAAGYLDYREYGRDGQGVKWLGEARAILKAIQAGTQRLLDSNDQELSFIASTNTIQSSPDEVDNQNGPIRMFTTNQRF